MKLKHLLNVVKNSLTQIFKKYVNKVFEVNNKLNYFDFIHSSRATTLSKIYLSQYNIIPNFVSAFIEDWSWYIGYGKKAELTSVPNIMKNEGFFNSYFVQLYNPHYFLVYSYRYQELMLFNILNNDCYYLNLDRLSARQLHLSYGEYMKLYLNFKDNIRSFVLLHELRGY